MKQADKPPAHCSKYAQPDQVIFCSILTKVAHGKMGASNISTRGMRRRLGHQGVGHSGQILLAQAYAFDLRIQVIADIEVQFICCPGRDIGRQD